MQIWDTTKETLKDIKMQYFKPLKSSDGNIYSLDMIRLNVDLGHHSQELVDYIQKLNDKSLETDTPSIKVNYYPNFAEFKYRHLWTLKSTDDIQSTVTVGLGKGTSREDQSKGFVEFNPNKVESNDELHSFLRHVRICSSTIDLVRYDMAIDIPLDRILARLTRSGRKGYQYIDSGNGITEYLGQRNKPGYIKLYDKTKESNLDYSLTRLELTLDKNSDLDSLFPTVRILNSQISLDFSDNDLDSTDKVLVALLKDCDNPQYYLSELGFRRKKKIEPYLADTTLLLDKKLAIAVKTLAMSYEL